MGELSPVCFHKHPQQLGPGEAEARNRNSSSISHVGDGAPHYLVIRCCLQGKLESAVKLRCSELGEGRPGSTCAQHQPLADSDENTLTHRDVVASLLGIILRESTWDQSRVRSASPAVCDPLLAQGNTGNHITCVPSNINPSG